MKFWYTWRFPQKALKGAGMLVMLLLGRLRRWMQPRLKKLEVFFSGTETRPYTSHNSQELRFTPAGVNRDFVLHLSESLICSSEGEAVTYKAAQTWDGTASSPPWGDSPAPGCSPCSFVEPPSADKGAALCCLPRYGYVQSSSVCFPRGTFKSLAGLLQTRHWKEAATVRLRSRGLTSSLSSSLFQELLGCSVHPHSARHDAETSVATPFPYHVSFYITAPVVPVQYRAKGAPSKIQHLG